MLLLCKKNSLSCFVTLAEHIPALPQILARAKFWNSEPEIYGCGVGVY